jgi:UDP-2-acetamido-2-deoxy-ribo-hexuluronate aminotransferase
MEFIDLKTQQVRIREKIEARIKTVLDHGKYIMGPEIFELEEKLAIFPEECDVRARVGSRYDTLLADMPGIETPVIPKDNTSVYAQYTILSENRDALSHALQTQHIPSVAYYTAPLHLQGAFEDLGHKPGDFPVSERLADQCLSLPMSPYLTSSDQKKVVDAIKQTPQPAQ